MFSDKVYIMRCIQRYKFLCSKFFCSRVGGLCGRGKNVFINKNINFLIKEISLFFREDIKFIEEICFVEMFFKWSFGRIFYCCFC